jgi:tetratricopeptide (TPR) repeat protein
MAVQTHPLRRLFARFFPRKVTSSLPQEKIETKELSPDQKSELAERYLSQGELQLLQGNLHALSLFEAASELAPENYETWYRQGLAFFEYGSEEGKEKSLLLAGKYFKTALQINPGCFNAWVAWGNALLQLGRFHQEHHFHLEAKEKYQRALELSIDQPQPILAELWWDYGIVWSEIARHSGEALDTKLAIEAFQKALHLQTRPSSEFWNDCGKAYLDMGLLINDDRLYLQSIDYLQKSVTQEPAYVDGWMSLAEAQAQLYINTLDERFANKAFDAYAAAAKLSPQDASVWLGWGQLLGESGRLNRDAKKLHLSIEKCARAATLDPEDPAAVAQWIESLSVLGSFPF